VSWIITVLLFRVLCFSDYPFAAADNSDIEIGASVWAWDGIGGEELRPKIPFFHSVFFFSARAASAAG